MKRFEGKVAVVTGGNSGIGLATAKAFAREGASVAITGRDEKSLKAAEKEIGNGALAIKADVSRLSEIDAAMSKIRERFKKIDVLFVNAGVGKFVPIDQVSEAFYDEIMAVNVKGLYFTVQKALPLLSRGSAVVLNASISGQKGMPGATVYAASKAAVLSLARNMSADLVPLGIRVNSVSPGPVETAILTRGGLNEEQLKQTKDWIVSQVPVKRFASADEIAEAVLYLSSPASSYVVGTDLVVDGGMLI